MLNATIKYDRHISPHTTTVAILRYILASDSSINLTMKKLATANIRNVGIKHASTIIYNSTMWTKTNDKLILAIQY